MAGFVTARDGIHTVLQTITGATAGYFKVGYAFDRRTQTDDAPDGYPYYTVSPAFDGSVLAHKGTMNSWSTYVLVVRIFMPHAPSAASEAAFLTLLDLTLTTLIANSNITLNRTVQSNLVSSVKLGYNDDAQPTMRIAEIQCEVTQRHDRSA